MKTNIQKIISHYPSIRYFFIMIFFGLLSLVIGEIKFYLPDIIGGTSDLREVPLLISVIYLPHWLYLFGVSLITSFGTPADGSFLATLIMHSVGGSIAWIFYRHINTKISNNFYLGLSWTGFVFIYYSVILIPILMTIYILEGILPSNNIIATYQNIFFNARFEIATTAAVSSLFIVMVRINAILNKRIKWHDLIIENANIGFWSINTKEKSVIINEQWAKMLGYSYEEAKSDNRLWEKLLHPDDRDKTIQKLNQFLAGSTKNYYAEYRLKSKSGDYRWILAKAKAIEKNSAGKILQYAGTHIDITEKKQLQEIMFQNEKMMSLGGLAAGLAHEIKNPIAGMLQNASVMTNRLSKESPKNRAIAEEIQVDFNKIQHFLEARKIFKMLRLIRETGERAADIISNMLSFSRKSESNFKEIEIPKTIDDTIKLLENDYDMKRNYDFKKIKIIKNYAENLPSISAQESKIKQVVMNILKNGAEAMAELEHKTTPSTFTITVSQENNYAHIVIENNGPPISEEVKKRIFEPFFTTKSKDKGTGLGLSISYFIITKDHGGKLYVESNGSTGARFIINLPISRH